ncbi:MAG TPA: hypothetical protein PJ982_04825, partial [Lacipirellulaceae bacterium]|nr:hypothetical protein [Lacipirellulaceae bacterium]
MNVTQIQVAGAGARPRLSISGVGPGFNVFVGPPGSGKSTLVQLAAHLMYGRRDAPARDIDAGTAVVEGSLEVLSSGHTFVLRRHRDGSRHGRLSVASAGGVPADNRTIGRLLGGVAPSLLASLFTASFPSEPQPSALLAPEFARQFKHAFGSEAHRQTADCPEHVGAASTPRVDRRQIDEMMRRRDAVVAQIEQLMSTRRQESASLEDEIVRLDSKLAHRRAHSGELAVRRQSVDAKLAEVAAQLRLLSLESVGPPAASGDAQQRQAALESLDAEIDRCRRALAELQTRDAAVRAELADVQPDGAADSAATLAAQRATIGVLEQLLEHLDAEVATLARSHEPGRCIAADAHGRVQPVAQLLRQQVYALCGQVSEQQRQVRRVHLRADLRQLARAQFDLGEQLEHLLERRHALASQWQHLGRAAAPPQRPASGLCQCEGHEDFVRNIDPAPLAEGDRARQLEELRRQRGDLEEQRLRLRNEIHAVDQEIASLAARWEQLQSERATAAGRRTLDELRSQLESLEVELGAAVQGSGPLALAYDGRRSRVWKASDVLAQLSSGDLTQVRLHRDGQPAVVIDRNGRS